MTCAVGEVCFVSNTASTNMQLSCTAHVVSVEMRCRISESALSDHHIHEAITYSGKGQCFECMCCDVHQTLKVSMPLSAAVYEPQDDGQERWEVPRWSHQLMVL